MPKPQDFKTRTILMERVNPTINDYWGVALDIGYSSVKGFSPNKVFCFPSFAKKSNNVSSLEDPDYILYRDSKTREEWIVGAGAQDQLTTDDTNDDEKSLYGRHRYFSPMFKAIARTGIGLGLLDNKSGSSFNKNLVLQTGLPPAYLGDSKYLQEALSGTHSFDIKISNGAWNHFEFELSKESIMIMSQPLGTLISISTDNNGNQTSEAIKYFKSSSLVFDPGFGTLDVFNMRRMNVESTYTFNNLGMKRVFMETIQGIKEQFGEDIPIASMQHILGEGTVGVFDIRTRLGVQEPINDILNSASEKVCLEALNKLDSMYNYFKDHKYFIITGGTGAAWSEIIRDYFKGISWLTVVSGNQNDNLPHIFSNVRGYYMSQYNRLKRGKTNS